MSPAGIGFGVFVCTFGGVLLGMAVRRRLPEYHLDPDSRDTVKLGVGLIATMTALVLGLITATAKGTFDATETAVRHVAMETLTLDRVLARYGPETREFRTALRDSLARRVEATWPRDGSRPSAGDPWSGAESAERLLDRIRALTPQTEAQREYRAQAVELSESLLEFRWRSAGEASSIPVPFLAILVFWLAVTFTIFGILAPGNGTVYSILLICALSVSSAVFLVLEMDGPFDGLLRVSPDALYYALEHLGR
jgi:hypothetical protein